MKNKILKTTMLLSTLLFCLTMAQKMPFPQAKNFKDCIKPKNVSQSQMNRDITDYYEFWKKNYLMESKNTDKGYYIKCKGTGGTSTNITVSEAHGWGMIVFALMDGYDSKAHEYFDGMYWFYDDHKSTKSNSNLMAWDIITGETSPSGGSATDGDMDIAYGLILAHYQWGSGDDINYLQKAKDICADILKEEVNNNRLMFGDTWSTNQWLSRPSDWMTGQMHTYYDITKVDEWNSLADEAYSMYTSFTTNHATKTGLITDFIINEAVDPCGKNCMDEYLRTDSYNFNACRVPWRIATDYAHHGETKAKAICDKIIGWLKTETGSDPAKIGIGYELDGTALNTDNSMAFTAPFMAACIVNKDHQDFLNKGWNVMRGDKIGLEYENSLNLMCMLLISGNWWKPGDASTPFSPPKVGKAGVLFDDFEDLFKDDPDQAFLGAAYGYAEVQEAGLGGSYWYTYMDTAGSKVSNHDGSISIDTSNGKEMAKDQKMNVKMITSSSKCKKGDYPYAGVGCAILRKGTSYYEFDKLEGITLRVRGKGIVRFEFSSYDLKDEEWGFYGFDLELSDKWMDTVISAQYFTPLRYSPADEKGWGWLDHGCNSTNKGKVKEIKISVRDSAKDATFEMDSIFFNGLDYKETFDFDLDTLITAISGLMAKGLINGFDVISNISGKSIDYSYSLTKQGNVSIEIYDVAGKTIAVLENSNHPKGFYSKTVDLNTLLSSGVYFIRCTMSNKMYNKKINFLK